METCLSGSAGRISKFSAPHIVTQVDTNPPRSATRNSANVSVTVYLRICSGNVEEVVTLAMFISCVGGGGGGGFGGTRDEAERFSTAQ